MLENIRKLREIRAEREEIVRREHELMRPVLTDLSLVPMLYGWFKEILADMPLPPNPESVTQRKKFLFVVVALYCPGAILGDRIKNGLREAIADTLGVSANVISNNMDDLLFVYLNYGEFAEESERICMTVLERMKKIRDNRV
jgi:hypothetical protein